MLRRQANFNGGTGVLTCSWSSSLFQRQHSWKMETRSWINLAGLFQFWRWLTFIIYLPLLHHLISFLFVVSCFFFISSITHLIAFVSRIFLEQRVLLMLSATAWLLSMFAEMPPATFEFLLATVTQMDSRVETLKEDDENNCLFRSQWKREFMGKMFMSKRGFLEIVRYNIVTGLKEYFPP